MLRRYISVVRPGRRPGAWYHQPAYGVPFRPGKRGLSVADVDGVLAHGRHVAVYAPGNGLTDYVAFDIDCKADGVREQRDARYWAIRRLLGIDRVPLVYATPSGAGLRLRYRIPSMPIERVITGRRTGLVADVLRAAGLPVVDGGIEIFPQRTQADRLPLGSRMPLLDPETLAPLPDAAVGAEYEEGMLRGAVARLERWHATVYDDLVPYLESLPGVPLPRVVAAETVSGRQDFVRVGSHVRPSDATLQLVHGGLVEPSSRYAAEYRVALAGVLAPEVLEPFGLVAVEDDEALAGAVARWLAERNNGFSTEWSDSLRRAGQGGAIRQWTARYLRRSGVTQMHFIDRVRAAAAQLDGSLRSTLLISDDERREVVHLAETAERAGLRGSSLYRAEVWLATSRRAMKRLIRYHLRAGAPLDQVEDHGVQFVFASISARWMTRWPYGSGARGRGDPTSTPNYVRYRQMLIDARWMRVTRFSPAAVAFRRGLRPPDDLALQASTYAVRAPRMDVRVRDVGVDALELRQVVSASGLEVCGRPLGLDEAHHILWLARTGVAVRRRYGYRLGVRLEGMARMLDNAVALG